MPVLGINKFAQTLIPNKNAMPGTTFSHCNFMGKCFGFQGQVTPKYSRTSMPRTLMARLPRLFRTRSSVPWKILTAADIG